MAAKSATQRKQEQRVRDAMRAQEEDEIVSKLFDRPFTEFWLSIKDKDGFEELDLPLYTIGINTPDFSEDRDYEVEDGRALGWDNRGALGRAERFAICLTETGQTLSRMLRDYKLAEIEKAMARITAAEFDTPEAKAQAFRDFATLERVKLKLAKQKR